MRLLAAQALVALLAATAFPLAARADATLLATTAASTLGATATADLVRTPHAGLGVFASRWDSQDFGTLTGYGVRLGGNLYRQLGLEVRASYLKADQDRFETTLIPLEASLLYRFSLGQHLAPYLGAGVGYYLKDTEHDDLDAGNNSENAAGYFGLAGIALALGPAALFAEAKYNLVGTDDVLRWRGADVESENSLDGLSLNAGLKLGF